MKKNAAWCFLLIFLLGAGLRVWYFSGNPDNMDIDGDEPWSRVNLALRWMQSDSFQPDLNFGPLQTYIISAARMFDPEQFLFLARSVTLAFGIIFIILYAGLINGLFGVKAALAGAFLLAIYPLHIHLSSVTLAEVPAAFFFLAAIYFFRHPEKKDDVFSLAGAALALNLCCMLRFEYAVFVVLFTGILFFRRASFRSICLFFFLSALFPFIWMVLNYRHTGDPLSFLHTATRVTQEEMRGISIFRRSFGIFKTLMRGLTLPVLAVSLAGVVIALRGKKGNKIFLFSLLFLFMFFELKSVQGTWAYYITRYSLVLGLLLIPFSWACAEYLAGLRFWKNARYARISAAAVFVLFCLVSSAVTLHDFAQKTRVPPSLVRLTEWIRAHTKSSDKLLLECGVFHPYIVVNSGLGLSQAIDYNHFGFIQGTERLDRYIREADYIFICKKYGKFRDLLAIPRNKTKAFANDDWKVYKSTAQ